MHVHSYGNDSDLCDCGKTKPMAPEVKFLTGVFFVTLILLLLSCLCHAQTYKKDVKVVEVPVYVTNALTNQAFTQLVKEHFRVFDNKVEQQIKYFSHEAEPMSVGIVLDTSGSISYKKDTAIQAVKEFLNQATLKDEFFLVKFNDGITNTGFVDSEEDLVAALPQFSEPHGRTALIDAVYMATTYIQRHARYDRRALLLISDGGDNYSRYTDGELINFLKEADVPVFVTAVLDAAPETPEERKGPDLLLRMAEASGGEGYIILDYKSLMDTMSYVGETLHNCYVLGFTPTNVKMDGKYHKIKVKLTRLPKKVPPLRFTARPGYYE